MAAPIKTVTFSNLDVNRDTTEKTKKVAVQTNPPSGVVNILLPQESKTLTVTSKSTKFALWIEGLHNPPEKRMPCYTNDPVQDLCHGKKHTKICSPYTWVITFDDKTQWPFSSPIMRPGDPDGEVYCDPYIGHVIGTASGNSYAVTVAYNTVRIVSKLLQPIAVLSSDTTITPSTTVAAKGEVTIYEIPSTVTLSLVPAKTLILYDAIPPVSLVNQPNVSVPIPPTPIPWQEGTVLSWPVMYTNASGYWYKQFAQVTMEYVNSGVTVTIDQDAESELGFGFETFGLPPFSQKANFGFYRATKRSFVPGAVFTMQSREGAQLRLAMNTDAVTTAGTSSATSKSALTWQANDPKVVPSQAMFSFLPSISGMQLVVTSNYGAQGYVGLRTGKSTSGQTSGGLPTLVVTAAEQMDTLQRSPGEWGAVQVYSPSLASNTVIILYRDGDGNKYVLSASATTSKDMPLPYLVPLSKTKIRFDNPPGFASVNGVPTNDAETNEAINYSVFLTELPAGAVASIPSAYLYNCWRASPFGCTSSNLDGFAFCSLQSTDAGRDQCTVTDSTNDDYNSATIDYVNSQCAFQYESDCKSVGGTAQQTCSGWNHQILASSCAQACQALEKISPGSCDQIKQNFCTNSAHAEMGDCACLRVADSNFPVALYGNRSYKDYLQFLRDTFGIMGQTELSPQCWWPTCGVPGFGGGLRLESTVATCPSTIVSCVTAIKDYNVDPSSTLDIRVRNECSISNSPNPSPGSDSDTCGFPVLPSDRTALAAKDKSTSTTTSFQLLDYAVVISLAVLVVVLLYVNVALLSKGNNFRTIWGYIKKPPAIAKVNPVVPVVAPK